MDPLVSVIVPTRNRPAKLRACLDRLAAQGGDAPAFEVVISLDGPCPASEAVCHEERSRLSVVVVEAPRQGIAVAKNKAIERARGELLVLINDDVLPETDFVSAHAAAHADRTASGLGEAMVVGHSPWVLPPAATLFDRLLAQSSMVFFYDRMVAADGTVIGERDRDWGFRHAWNLNLSLATSLVHQAGGFCPAIANCCYEDIELAWRVSGGRDEGVPVLFRPEALAPHDHAYTPGGYLQREFRLGYSAFGFAKASPHCAREVFGTEIDSVDELAYSARFIAHEERAEDRLRDALECLAMLPATAIGDGDQASKLLTLIEQQQILLKRLVFRRGLILAAEGGAIAGLFHPSDGLETGPSLPGHAGV